MADSVNLVVPVDARFRGLGPEVAGRYVVAAGGSETDAAAIVDALAAAIGELTGDGPADGGGVELELRAPGNAVEVTVRCQGKSSVVTHPLPATST